MTDAKNLLLCSADLLEAEGWTQGTYKNEDGCHCSYGALMACAGVEFIVQNTGEDGSVDYDLSYPNDFPREAYTNAEQLLLTAIRANVDRFFYGITTYNDEYASSKDEVVALFRAAAELAG